MASNSVTKQFQNFPVPKLDDRSWQDLMEEMRSLIPIYCPEWTNHNPSDPGITILELFAFLSEIMLYRLNRVPVKNLFALLDVLGIQPSPPVPARTVLVVSPTPGSHGTTVPQGTAVGARRSGSGEPIQFETEQPILLTTGTIARAVAFSGTDSEDVTEFLSSPTTTPFAPFQGKSEIERYLYLMDGRFLTLREQGMRVHIRFQGESAVRDLYARWRWEYFNGEGWYPARLAVGHGKGEVILDTMPDLSEFELNGVVGSWLRALPLPGENDPSEIYFDDIEVEVESVEEGVLPDAVFLNVGGETVYSNLDLTRIFYPLGERPRRESAVYIMARELFRAAGTRVELSFVAPEVSTYPRPEPSTDLALKVEYPIPGNRWGLIRTITPNPFVQSGENKFKLDDSSRGLRRGGVISFIVPSDMQQREIQGVSGPWVRIRLVSGEYRPPLVSNAESESPDGGGDDKPLGPAFEALNIRSKAPAVPIAFASSYSDFTLMELWDANRPRGNAAQVFPVREAYVAALYLGFSEMFPIGKNQIYFKILDNGDNFSEEYEADVALQRVAWELGTPAGFVPLPSVADDTLHLKRDGFLSFSAPPDTSRIALFGESLYWIRARLAEGRYDIGPMIADIKLNAVNAIHVTTIVESRVIPSDGQAAQTFELMRSPVVGNLIVRVLERETPRPEIMAKHTAEFGDEALLEDADGAWLRWRQVSHFFSCGPEDRVFRLDPNNGFVRFGDGIHGKIPPPGPRVILIESYQTGGGSRGNVGAHTLSVVKESNSAIAGVDNPYPADGGAEEEDLSAAASRGTRQMFTVDRAYRAEDYENLARQASRRVAKVRCLEPRPTDRRSQKRGEAGDFGDEPLVRVLIVPDIPFSEATMRDKLVPSYELIRRVEEYLERRRVINTRVAVRGPRYIGFSVLCTVYLRGRGSAGADEDIQRRLFQYLHPLSGGEDGKGWAFGQTVRRVSLFQVVSGSPMVMSVLDLKMFDRYGNLIDGSLILRDDQLPFLMSVKVEAAVLK